MCRWWWRLPDILNSVVAFIPFNILLSCLITPFAMNRNFHRRCVPTFHRSNSKFGFPFIINAESARGGRRGWIWGQCQRVATMNGYEWWVFGRKAGEAKSLSWMWHGRYATTHTHTHTQCRRKVMPRQSRSVQRSTSSRLRGKPYLLWHRQKIRKPCDHKAKYF